MLFVVGAEEGTELVDVCGGVGSPEAMPFEVVDVDGAALSPDPLLQPDAARTPISATATPLARVVRMVVNPPCMQPECPVIIGDFAQRMGRGLLKGLVKKRE